MDPITATLIIAGISAAVAGGGAAIQMVPTKSEKRIKAETEALEDRFRRGDIGLSRIEEERLASMGLSAVQGAEREYYAREAELAALTGVTGGQLIAQQQAAQDRIMQQRAEVGKQLREAELAQRAADREQLNLLRQAQQAIQDKRRGEAAALLGEAGDIAASSVELYTGLERMQPRPTPGATPTSELSVLEQLLLEQANLPQGSRIAPATGGPMAPNYSTIA